jgi:hypothetical protein
MITLQEFHYYLRKNLFTITELKNISGLSTPVIYKFKNGGNCNKSTVNTIEDSIYKLLNQKKEEIKSILRHQKRKIRDLRLENFEDVFGEDIDQLNYESSRI